MTMSMNDSGERERQIPLCKLSIQKITYAPLTQSYYNSSPRGRVVAKSVMKRRKTILNNVTPPPVEAFKLQAWMGPSGSG